MPSTMTIWRAKQSPEYKEYQRNCQKRYREKHKELVNAKSKLYRDTHKEELKKYFQKHDSNLKSKFNRWKKSAKTRQIEWNLCFEDIENLELVCYYTGRKLTLEINNSNTVSLDRIDSLKGYEKDNVVFCCSVVNFMKREYTEQEFKQVCMDVVKNIKQT